MLKKIVFGLTLSVCTLFADGFVLKSNELMGQLNSKQVFNGFGCTGENISPALSWENAPEQTKSFAVTMYDKDAPTGSGWWHWVVFNIPTDVTKLQQNSGDPLSDVMPKGVVQSKTDYGTNGYGGACPPVGHGAHQYLFTVYALDTAKLDLDQNASPALVGYMLDAHTISKASLVVYYGR